MSHWIHALIGVAVIGTAVAPPVALGQQVNLAERQQKVIFDDGCP